MSAIEDLTEVAARAADADAIARSSKWLDRDALQRKADELTDTLSDAAATLDRDPLGPVRTSVVWLDRARSLLTDPPDLSGEPAPVAVSEQSADAGIPEPPPSTGTPEHPAAAEFADLRAATAETDATAAVNVARIALVQAYRAVLEARLAAIDAGDTARTDAAIKGYRPTAGSNPVVIHGPALFHDVGDELRHIVADRPRDIALRITISLAFGLAYLAVLRYVFWRQTVEAEFPYLALYAFSGIAGSMVCTNALCMDPGRVRAKLLAGERLWHIMVAKNLAVGAIVGTLGLALNILVLIWTKDWTTFLKACAMFVTMLLLWFGVGNVLSIVAPLTDVPLIRRPRDGTLWRFLATFCMAYGISYLVNLMLYWRVWAKETLLERFAGPWVPVLMIVASALEAYVLLTVAALSLAQHPARRRRLVREMVDYRTLKTSS
jgi:hypothetical protein